jgi:TfoX/Sxy family transcriptional regulator of competence genes
MATTKEYAAFICEQLALAGEISCRKMFGEYGVYCNGKYFAVICDNRFLVKPTEAGQKLMTNARMEQPYEGGKPMMLVEDLEDTEFLRDLVQTTCAALPAPKPKKPQKKKGGQLT